MTHTWRISIVREEAKKQKMTLRTHKSFKINGAAAYYIIDRKTGDALVENCTLGSAYECLLSGYAASQQLKKGYEHA